MTVAGFAVPFALLTAVVLGYRADFLGGVGWAGGEYAYAFVAVAIGAVVAGVVLQLVDRRSPWRRFGTGMLLGGGLGVVFVAVAIGLFWYAFANVTS